MKTQIQTYSAFDNNKLIVHGSLEDVVLRLKKKFKDHSSSSPLVFSDLTGKQMDFDLTGTEKEVLQRLQVYFTPEESSPNSGPGRPKLGVVAREVSLLPRHWEWLATQSGGASATLRRLIEEAKKNSSESELLKQSQERTYKFMSSIAGNFENYEDALRALYAKDKKKFNAHINHWPDDIKEYVKTLSDGVF